MEDKVRHINAVVAGLRDSMEAIQRGMELRMEVSRLNSIANKNDFDKTIGLVVSAMRSQTEHLKELLTSDD